MHFIYPELNTTFTPCNHTFSTVFSIISWLTAVFSL